MPKLINYRMPNWFPCFLSTLIAFAVSFKPSMSLATLPEESFLSSVPPTLAVLGFTALGFAWGFAITFLLKRSANATNSADRPKTLCDAGR